MTRHTSRQLDQMIEQVFVVANLAHVIGSAYWPRLMPLDRIFHDWVPTSGL